jgi:hypothetical protein
MAKENPFRFSTKRKENTTEVELYELRTRKEFGWLCRDPLGGTGNGYLFADNNPACKIDLYGLSPLATVQQKLAVAGIRTMPSQMVGATHFEDALKRLSRLASRILAKYGDPGPGKNALWLIHQNTMEIRNDSVAPDTVIHEMTHAVQDLELHYPFNDERREEGQAFAMEGFYRLAESLKIGEIKLQRAECSAGEVAEVWQEIWRQYGNLPSLDWGEVAWSDWLGRTKKEPLNKQDLFEIYDIFGVKLSCSALAQVVNGILADHHCCIAVTCSETGNTLEIPPGVQIDPFFQ